MSVLLLNGNALHIPLADNSVHCVVTSPPYFSLRDYGVEGQLGLEETPEEYVANMVAVFREVKRVLRPDGVLFLNLGDSYAGSWGNYGAREGNQRSRISEQWHRPAYEGDQGFRDLPSTAKVAGLKPKDLIGIPWLVAFALRADGWWLRSEIIWCKKSAMPESVTDRPTNATEKIFLLTKSAHYFYDQDGYREKSKTDPESKAAMAFGLTSGKNNTNERAHAADLGHKWEYSPTRNMRNYWLLGPEPYLGAHFATFVTEIPRRAILVGTSQKGCCPKCGSQWERLTEKPEGYPTGSYHDHKMDGVGYGLRQNSKGPKNLPLGMQAYTTGWRPTCQHDLDPVPATVFDPFAGSGTTLLVARELGRNGIGLDLTMPYLRDQARDRLSMIALDEWQHGKRNGKAGEMEGLPMFEVDPATGPPG